VERAAESTFNSVLGNLYRDGRDSMGFHADNEKELGRDPVIASLSLGATRRFQLRHAKRKDVAGLDLALASGSLLIMRGATQHHFRHGVPKEKAPTGERINLTFRRILGAAT
jgi:alkylated DNA repair dioxygenase AlkB